jgi:signal peptidase I
MLFFTPKYLKTAKILRDNLLKFIHFKRDLLNQEELSYFQSSLEQLKISIRNKDRQSIESLQKELEARSKAFYLTPIGQSVYVSGLGENIESLISVFFLVVSFTVYIFARSAIPTGSMQPTLNGIFAIPTQEDPTPSFSGKLLSYLTAQTHINLISDHSGNLRSYDPIVEGRSLPILAFLPHCTLHFSDGHTLKVNCPKRHLTQLMAYQIDKGIDLSRVEVNFTNFPIKQGQLIARGIIQNGDALLVNQFKYHFVRPKKDDIFVFHTRHIKGIENRPDFDKAAGSQFYVKRLCGEPNDTIEINNNKLLINQSSPTQPGILRVMSGTAENPQKGYKGYSNNGFSIKLFDNEFLALGDNSYSSFDSRNWGPVPARNIYGSPSFCIYPFGSHWGFVR